MSPEASMPVTWAIVIGVDGKGLPHLIDHEDNYLVHASRPATFDDIYAACTIIGTWHFTDVYAEDVDTEEYVVAFVVFQTIDGHILASPNVFEPIVPTNIPTNTHIQGGLSVLQSTITAQKSVEAIQMAAAMSRAMNRDPEADKKSAGGLYVA